MHFSFGYPIIELDPAPELLTAAAIGRIARAAEHAGFAALSMTEHPAPPQAWRDDHGHDALDPFVGLATAAALTTSIHVLTYLSVLPYRNPFLVAKATATLDRISGGRLIFGIGTGYLAGEFTALGVDFAERNELFGECVAVLRAAWTGKPVYYEGRHFLADGAVSVPTPVQARVPLWIGGNARRTRDRVAELADGWMPIPTKGAQVTRRSTAELASHSQLAAMIAEVKSTLRQRGRSESIDIMYLIDDIDPWDDPERYADRVRELASIGVTWVQGGADGRGVDEIVDRLAWFGERIIASANAD
jgi:probable F420-dependent oxidoreductase